MSTGKFFIPNASKKNENIQILEAGPNPGILYAIVDQGTSYNKYWDKTSRTLRLIFEFPLLKQLFNEGDTEERPTVVSQEYSFILGESSNLVKKFINGAEGRVLNKSEYSNGWDLSKYLGRTFIVDIVNRPNKKDPAIIHNNIGEVKALSDGLRNRYNFDWDSVTITNPMIAFIIDPDGQNFTTEDYANLPPYLKKKIADSDEGIRFSNNGGVFAQKNKSFKANDPNVQKAAPVQRQAQAPKADANAPIKKMLVEDFTYEQYLASGWDDAALIEAKKMVLVQNLAPTPAPAPAGPSGPSAPTETKDDLEPDDLPF